MVDLPSDAYVAHISSGRLRIRIPSRKGNSSFLDSVKVLFAGLPGLQSMEANPVTGSLLVLHSSGEAAVRALLDSYNLSGASRTVKGKPAASAVHGEIATIFRGWDRQIQNFSVGNLNLEAVVAISLIGMAAYQISRGRFILLPWYNALWYAFSLLKG